MSSRGAASMPSASGDDVSQSAPGKTGFSIAAGDGSVADGAQGASLLPELQAASSRAQTGTSRRMRLAFTQVDMLSTPRNDS